MKTLKAALRPVMRRMRKERALRWGGYALATGTAGALLLSVAAFFWPISGATAGMVALAVVPALCAVLAGLAWPVPVAAAAKQADRCGLMARIQTALELESASDTPIALLQREDARRALEGLCVQEAMRMKADRLCITISCAALALCLGLSFVPNPQRAVLQAKAVFRQEMAKQAQLVEDGAKGLDDEDEAAALEARKILGDLVKELREAGDARAALTAVDTAERKIQQLKQSDASTLGSLLAAQGLESAAEALEKEDAEALQRALEQEDPEQLASALEQAALEAASSQMSAALKQAAQSAAAGNMAQAQAALSAALSSGSNFANQAAALAQMARAGTGRACQSLGTATQGSMPASLSGMGMSPLGQGSGQGSGSAGQGAGQGIGAGSGAGKGSTNLDAGYTDASSGGHAPGGGVPQEKLGEYEAIYDPTRLGTDGEVANEKGTLGQGETTEVTLGAGLGTAGESVPYTEVANEYQQSAVQAAENADLPLYAQKWVEAYFGSLLE